MQSESSTSTGQPVEQRERSSVWMIAVALLLLGLIGACMIERRGTVAGNALPTSDVVLPDSAGALKEYQNAPTDHAVIIVPDEAAGEMVRAALAAEGSVVSARGGAGLTVEVLVIGNGITAAQLRRELAESNSLLLGTGHELLVYEAPN